MLTTLPRPSRIVVCPECWTVVVLDYKPIGRVLMCDECARDGVEEGPTPPGTAGITVSKFYPQNSLTKRGLPG